jgi:hypothetical protein
MSMKPPSDHRRKRTTWAALPLSMTLLSKSIQISSEKGDFLKNEK